MEAPTGDLRSQLIGNTQSDGAVFKTVLFYSVLILLLPIGCFFTTKSIIFETILGQVSFFSVKIVLYDRTSGVHDWDQHRERCSGRDSAASRSRIIYLQGLSSRVAPSPQSSLGAHWCLASCSVCPDTLRSRRYHTHKTGSAEISG